MRRLILAAVILATSLVFAQQAALVVIDMQPYFLTRGGNHLAPGNVIRANLVLQRQARLIQIAKENHVPIIKIEYKGHGSTNETLNQQIGDYDLVETFIKSKDGMFHSAGGVAEELKEHLNSLGISDLVISGANGGYCVRCSIEGALENGYRIWADSHAIIDFNPSNFVHPYHYAAGVLRISPEILDANFVQADNHQTIEGILQRGPHQNDSDPASIRCASIYH